MTARETGQTVSDLLGYPAASLQGLILSVLAARRLAALDKRTADSLDFFVPTIPVHQRIG